MSKRITKVIAALGVVAGLGIAALPLSSYAETAPLNVKVTVGGTFVLTTDPSIATCTNNGGTSLPNASYGDVSLVFTDTTGVMTDDSGICLQSNSTGTYDISIGTPPQAYDSSVLYSEGVAGAESSALTHQKIPAASGTLVSGTAGWGYKFKGANRGAATTTGAINADANYVAPTMFGSGHTTGGRALGTTVQIPNGVGDYYGITVGAAVSSSHQGEYDGQLTFYAAVN